MGKDDQRKIIGGEGEQKAAEHLEKTGYKIIARNLKLVCGEVDILALDKRSIVIVEVKTVSGSGFGLAQELVRFKKQKKLRQLGRAVEQKYPDRNIRIDVIGVDFSWGEAKVEHIQNAVEAF